MKKVTRLLTNGFKDSQIIKKSLINKKDFLVSGKYNTSHLGSKMVAYINTSSPKKL